MTREAQLIADWASQFKSCAVDNMPFDVILELRNKEHPDLCTPPEHFKSARFCDGKYQSGLFRELYAERDDLIAQHAIEIVVDYTDLIGQLLSESEISIDLTEVL